MTIKNKPDFHIENERLDFTKEKIKDAVLRIENNKEKYQQDIKQAMLDLDYLDSSQSYITILTTAQFMKMDRDSYERLIKGINKPYFARIDFKATDFKKQRYYIGKFSLMDDKSKEPIVIDWRSPIASVYYEGRLGEVEYKSPQGVIEGALSLKRQFTIEDGQLIDYIDIDITTNDAFLQASLEAGADNRLKDIASSIQAEQNRVIRADITGPLIVQGVAGSGKTTIALHRIAYLIYTYEDKFVPENFMVIAPNRLFINYISEVLPELGVERINQTTYADFVLGLIGHKFKVINPHEKLVELIEDNLNEKERDLLRKAAGFKGSLVFKEIIDKYIENLEAAFLPVEDFALENHVIYSYQELKRLFLEEYRFLPLYKRLPLIKKVLNNKLKTAKQKILQEIEDRYNKEIELIRYSWEESEETRLKLIGLADERDEKLKEIKSPSSTIIKKYLAKMPNRDLYAYYQDVISNLENLTTASGKIVEEELVQFLSQKSLGLLDKKSLEYEDLAALVYLKHRLFGFDEKIEVNHVVIDEAQDFNLFQFYILKTILNTNHFSILGDLSQGIYSYRGTNDWQEVISQIFSDTPCQFLTLEQSYRTTIEIMDLANKVIKNVQLPNIILAKPVIRHGDKPLVAEFKNTKEIIKSITQKLNDLQGKYKSTAIICKTLDDCKLVKSHLHKEGIKADILKGDEKEYHGGIVIVPSYIAKGLEFDIVFIVSINGKYALHDLDVKLLYVAITRAMHKLYVYSLEGKIPLLSKI
ncbi:MAG: RNA polymerase recycling motor HelD [Bacillota bacterium]